MKTTMTRIALISFALALIPVPAFSADDVAALYKGKCQACHGPDGVATAMGKKLNARDFTSADVKKLSEKELIEVTTKGKNKLPAFDKKLTAEQIDELADYVHDQQRRHGGERQIQGHEPPRHHAFARPGRMKPDTVSVASSSFG